MNKIYNTYKNNRGQNLPKSPIIPNSKEIREWLKEKYSFAYANSINLIDESKPWLAVGIGASYAGYLYPHISTHDETELSRYDDSMIKIFTEDEPFKKYLNWAMNIPKYIVNKR